MFQFFVAMRDLISANRKMGVFSSRCARRSLDMFSGIRGSRSSGTFNIVAKSVTAMR